MKGEEAVLCHRCVSPLLSLSKDSASEAIMMLIWSLVKKTYLSIHQDATDFWKIFLDVVKKTSECSEDHYTVSVCGVVSMVDLPVLIPDNGFEWNTNIYTTNRPFYFNTYIQHQYQKSKTK